MNSHNGHATHGVSHGRRDDALADGPNELSRTDGALAAAAPAEPRTVQTTAGPGRKPRSRFSVARTARMCIALALITAALWWLVVPFFVPVTSQAVVNARMVQVRAPIDGAAVELLHDIGDSVQAGAPLLKVVSGQADTSHLAELAARRAGLAAQRERLNSELEAAARTRDECHASTQRFYTELVGSLKTSVTEAEARYQAARVGQEAAHVRTARAERLAAEQTGAYAELDEARANESVANHQVQQEEAARSRLEEELRAAKQGFLFERDAPSFEQRASELDSKIPQLQGEIKETDAKLAAADTELEAEHRRIDRLSEEAVTAPVAGTVWKRNGEPGQVVKRDENLLEIADRGTIFVEALLPQTQLGAIAPGCRAVVRLSDGRVLDGHVRAVRTLGGADTEASFAINMPCPDMKQVRVLIDFDAPTQDAALIGRHARVLITDAHPGPLQQALTWLFARVGV